VLSMTYQTDARPWATAVRLGAKRGLAGSGWIKPSPPETLMTERGGLKADRRVGGTGSSEAVVATVGRHTNERDWLKGEDLTAR
jgi:hypothetical protein